MSNSVAQALPLGKRKPLAARLPQGESLHKSVVSGQDSDVFKPILGAVIEAALRGAGLTDKEATYRMGYGQNMAPLSNWKSGKENPQLSRLWAIGRAFRTQLVIALAEACDADVEVKTVVTVSQRRTGTE